MFRLVTLNLNGIRSAANKGLLPWAESLGADCMGVQEIKAQAADLEGRFEHLAGMKGHFHFAQKKGYSGVGVYARRQPSDVIEGFGVPEFDAEGRYVEVRFDTLRRRFSVISCYFPSGSSGEERQHAKFRFLEVVYPHLEKLKAQREFILVGDINIAHKEIDLKNWRGNQKNSGFLPEERAWMTKALDHLGLVDVFRRLNPHPEQYTWWSNRGQAWAKNVGWRLDYHLATSAIAARARREHIYLEQRFSDHAPLTIDYDFKL
ncbi:MAG TPA: exodeoxyribonuclease III [Burkholderiaceae bacterium]|nr:exodeoxyribonuclease III [Burkholderiaceae bacterium]